MSSPEPISQSLPQSQIFHSEEAALPQSLAGIVTRVSGYHEKVPRDFRSDQPASLIVPLVISFGDPFLIGLGRAPRGNERFGSFAAGLFAGPVIIRSFGASSCIQVDFTPLGARRFFGLPMSELTAAMVPLEDCLGSDGSAMREQLGNLRHWPARFEVVLAFLSDRLGRGRPAARDTSVAFETILRSGGRIPIMRIAARLGISRKHLAARFRDDIGLGPKAVARIARFERALKLASSRRTGLADVAADCGFSDQAHMTREFASLGGHKPSELQSRDGPVTNLQDHSRASGHSRSANA